MKGIKDKIDKLRDLIKLQGSSGNWNYDSYMHGMYNGMEIALSLMEDRDPNFRNAPKVWLKDKASPGPVFIRTYLICA